MIQIKTSFIDLIHKIFCLLFFTFFITSCAIPAHEIISPIPVPPTTPSWDERKAALSNISTFNLKGKIAVQTSQQSGSAMMDWSQQQKHYTISLYGPLGSGGLKLSGEPGNIILETNDGKKVSATSPESLLKKEWGFNVPVSNLRYWVRGIPVPKLAYDGQFDNEHRLRQLTQDGYLIQFLGYTKRNGFDLPNKIFITNPSLKTKLIIYEWQAR